MFSYRPSRNLELRRCRVGSGERLDLLTLYDRFGRALYRRLDSHLPEELARYDGCPDYPLSYPFWDGFVAHDGRGNHPRSIRGLSRKGARPDAEDGAGGDGEQPLSPQGAPSSGSRRVRLRANVPANAVLAA